MLPSNSVTIGAAAAPTADDVNMTRVEAPSALAYLALGLADSALAAYQQQQKQQLARESSPGVQSSDYAQASWNALSPASQNAPATEGSNDSMHKQQQRLNNSEAQGTDGGEEATARARVVALCSSLYDTLDDLLADLDPAAHNPLSPSSSVSSMSAHGLPTFHSVGSNAVAVAVPSGPIVRSTSASATISPSSAALHRQHHHQQQRQRHQQPQLLLDGLGSSPRHASSHSHTMATLPEVFSPGVSVLSPTHSHSHSLLGNSPSSSSHASTFSPRSPLSTWSSATGSTSTLGSSRLQKQAGSGVLPSADAAAAAAVAAAAAAVAAVTGPSVQPRQRVHLRRPSDGGVGGGALSHPYLGAAASAAAADDSGRRVSLAAAPAALLPLQSPGGAMGAGPTSPASPAPVLLLPHQPVSKAPANGLSSAPAAALPTTTDSLRGTQSPSSSSAQGGMGTAASHLPSSSGTPLAPSPVATSNFALDEVLEGAAAMHMPAAAMFDLSDSGLLGVSWSEVHARVQDTLTMYDESFVTPLVIGTLPTVDTVSALAGAAAALHAATRTCLARVERSSGMRAAAFAIHVFAQRVEMEARNFLETLLGDAATGAGTDAAEGQEERKGVAELLEEVAEEIEGIWKMSEGTLYGLGVANVRSLVRYSVLGQALWRLSKGERARDVVRAAEYDEPQKWEDGMDELRALVHARREGAETSGQLLGTRISLGLISDYTWYAAWVGAESGQMAIDKIPSEVPVSMLLADLGAPRSIEPYLLVSDRAALQRLVLPEFRAGVQKHLVKGLLAWMADVPDCSPLDLHKGRMGQHLAATSVASAAAGGYSGGNAAGATSGSLHGGSSMGCHGGGGAALGCKSMKLEDILVATNSWSADMKLGEGGFGTVYRGVSADGEQWAVKRANVVSAETLEEFTNEVAALSKMSHQHLIRLLGYWGDFSERILVYEFASNGSLASRLHPSPSSPSPLPPLSFDQRLEIAVGAAEGLRYLHCFAQPAVIHRDIKSDNILLSDSMQAKVADFGRLKRLSTKGRHTRVMGTPGYCDPEYSKTYIATEKSDVYSFGVVLLEILTGKRAIIEEVKKKGFLSKFRCKRSAAKAAESQSAKLRAPTTLVSWAIPLITAGRVRCLMDPTLGDSYTLSAAKAMASVAASCVQKNPCDRPTMTEVATRLSSILYRIKELKLMPCERIKSALRPREPTPASAVPASTAMAAGGCGRGVGSAALFARH